MGILRPSIFKVSLPKGFVVLENGAFSESNISTFKAEPGLEIIKDSAFSHCTNLARVLIPKTVKIIGNRVFKDCYSLNEIEIPGKLEACGKEIFKGCAFLSKITCRYEHEDLAREWVNYCPNLKKIDFKNEYGRVVKSWGAAQFRDAKHDTGNANEYVEKFLDDYDSDYDANAHFHGKNNFEL